MKIKQGAALFGVAAAIVGAAYLDSPFSVLNNQYYYQKEGPPEAQVNSFPDSRQQIEYEQRLVETRKSNGYITEVYQEYEVVKDSAGNEIKRNPTGHTEEIRYRDYSFKKVP